MNQRLKKSFKEDKKIWYIIAYILFTVITYELFNRPFGNVHVIKIPFDDKIPFIKEMIIPYHTYLPLLIVVGLMLLYKDEDLYIRYVMALFLAQITAYVIFMNFQTYVPRYDTNLLGDDIFSRIIRLTYSVDNTYSGAPSMHVCNSILASYYIGKSSYSKKCRVPMIAYLCFVASTTVFVKQHVFLDIPSGIIHAIISIILVNLYFKNKEKKWQN